MNNLTSNKWLLTGKPYVSNKDNYIDSYNYIKEMIRRILNDRNNLWGNLVQEETLLKHFGGDTGVYKGEEYVISKLEEDICISMMSLINK